MRPPSAGVNNARRFYMRELSLDQFSEELYSNKPIPGGGGASALIGAMAASLAGMVGNLTTGKKKYAEYQADIERILRDSDALRLKMNALIEKDAEVFEPLSKAYGIPKDEPGRDEILEKALKTASDAPMEIVRTASEVMALIEELTVKGSRLAISDVGVAAAACEACAKGAVMNVYINTKLMKDRKVAEEVNKEADALVKDIVSRAEAAYNNVKNSLI